MNTSVKFPVRLEWSSEIRIDDLSGETARIYGSLVIDKVPFKIPKAYDERYIKLDYDDIAGWRESLQDNWWAILEAVANVALDEGFAVAYDESKNLVIFESPWHKKD